MRLTHKGILLVGVVAALLLGGCTVRTSTLPLRPSATPTPSVSAVPTPTPSAGITIPIDAPQPTASIPPREYVSASDVGNMPARKTGVIYVCVGPELLSPVGSQVRVRIVNAEHVPVYSRTAPLPFARAIAIVPGRYVASLVPVDKAGGASNNTISAKSQGKIGAGESIYLISGNSCPKREPH